jgi:hypothetical protein
LLEGRARYLLQAAACFNLLVLEALHAANQPPQRYKYLKAKEMWDGSAIEQQDPMRDFTQLR